MLNIVASYLQNHSLVKIMDSYFLELRLSGSVRRYIRQLALRVAHDFQVKGLTAHRVVPHVSVVGSFNTVFEKG
jgi:hypothetical protein